MIKTNPVKQAIIKNLFNLKLCRELKSFEVVSLLV